jgi:hypothetical protein
MDLWVLVKIRVAEPILLVVVKGPSGPVRRERPSKCAPQAGAESRTSRDEGKSFN